MKSIGEIYFDSSFFMDEASKTIGQPLIGENAQEIFENRRKVKGKLNAEGQIYLNKILSDLKEIFNKDEIKVVWDKFCGCSMCPCSPGYRVKINREVRALGKYRFSLWVSEKGEFTFRSPQYSFDIGPDNVRKLENTFSNK
jgi:hypothetical protein